MKTILILMFTLTSCSYLKTDSQLGRGASQYELYEFNTHECHACKMQRILAELQEKQRFQDDL